MIENLVPENFIQSSDENFLTVIFRNLLQNAIRYGDKTKPGILMYTGQSIAYNEFFRKERGRFTQ